MEYVIVGATVVGGVVVIILVRWFNGRGIFAYKVPRTGVVGSGYPTGSGAVKGAERYVDVRTECD